jgi:hypothetical protein
MFEASVDGEAFDMERWGQYFKPSGYNAPAGNKESKSAKPAAPVATPTPDESEDTPVESSTASAPTKSDDGGSASARAQDILAMIRNRQKA